MDLQKSSEEDYFSLDWIDLIVGYVAGTVPLSDGKVAFNPIVCGLESFLLQGVRGVSHCNRRVVRSDQRL
jgi:hypothetical protein